MKIQTPPNEPQIFLGNYLWRLSEKENGEKGTIYLKNVGNFTAQIWREIVRTKWRKLHVRNLIPSKLGIKAGSFYSYKNGRKAISIQMMHELLCLWQEICGKSDEEMEEKWCELFNLDLIYPTRLKSIKLPSFLTPKLSYVLGWMCGDGNLSESRNHYVVAVCEKSQKQLKLVLNPLFQELFNVHAPIFRKSSNGYILQVGAKPVFKFFKKVLGFKTGKIPIVIQKADNINKRYFVSGFFDAEGHVDVSDPRIVISQANLHFLKEIAGLFEEINIHFMGPYFHKNEKGAWFTIQLRKKPEILKFINNIGSCHVDKSQKLRELVMQIEKDRGS